MFVRKHIILIVFSAMFVVVAAVPSYYFYHQYRNLEAQMHNPTKESPAVYVERAGRHIILPDNEIPTVLTVTDTERLSGQAFFSHAKNGDKVLVYEQAKKAFLYDPKADKIVEVGPVINSATNSALAQHAVTPTPTPRILHFVLYNGTTTVGLTKDFEQTLLSKIPDAIVLDRDNAARNDYESSVLIDVSENNSGAQDIADMLDMQMTELPEGETKPEEADFLIILGSDVLE